jgi:hypothetical protein
MADNEYQDPSVRLRGGLFLSVQQMQEIQAETAHLASMVPARYILVVDTSGQVVCNYGDDDQADLPVLGSLIAADLAASQEIARLTGDYQDYQMILREGSRTHIAISEAGRNLAMLVAFPASTSIGWARKLIQIATKEICMIAAKSSTASIPEINEVASDDLPDLYKDALDKIWKD